MGLLGTYLSMCLGMCLTSMCSRTRTRTRTTPQPVSKLSLSKLRVHDMSPWQSQEETVEEEKLGKPEDCGHVYTFCVELVSYFHLIAAVTPPSPRLSVCGRGWIESCWDIQVNTYMLFGINNIGAKGRVPKLTSTQPLCRLGCFTTKSYAANPRSLSRL